MKWRKSYDRKGIAMQKEASKRAPSNCFEGMVSLRAIIESNLLGTNDRKIERVWLEKGADSKKVAKRNAWLRHRAMELGFTIEEVERTHIEETALGTSHGGVLAFCGDRTIGNFTQSVLQENKRGVYALLDGIEDPYNFGYALRSLYASGVDGILLSERNWMSAAGVVCRASAGASERFSLYRYQDPHTLCDLFHQNGYRILCADIEDSVSVYDSDLSRPLFFIVGGEKRGISAPFLEHADQIVRLEYGRKFDAALSAASAASILGYEIYRQNR
jgi:23S rRNA (guanosine2251-2'-O)-methyltransferase